MLILQKVQENKITQTFEHLYEILKNGLEENASKTKDRGKTNHLVKSQRCALTW